MLKNGKDALLVTFITGVFGALMVILKDQNVYVALAVYAVTLVAVYAIIQRSTSKVKDMIGSPESHPVFYTIDNGIKMGFDYLPISHAKKKRLVVQYIKTKFLLIREALTQTIDDDDIAQLPIRVVCAVAMTKDRMVGHAPDAFIEKMAEWDNKYNYWTMDALRSIIDSSYYSDKNMKYGACFDCIQVMIRSTFMAAENSIKELNGELEKYLDGREDV